MNYFGNDAPSSTKLPAVTAPSKSQSTVPYLQNVLQQQWLRNQFFHWSLSWLIYLKCTTTTIYLKKSTIYLKVNKVRFCRTSSNVFSTINVSASFSICKVLLDSPILRSWMKTCYSHFIRICIIVWIVSINRCDSFSDNLRHFFSHGLNDQFSVCWRFLNDIVPGKFRWKILSTDIAKIWKLFVFFLRIKPAHLKNQWLHPVHRDIIRGFYHL